MSTAPKKRPAHRPPEMEGGRRVNVYLDTVSLKRAFALGDGNVSAGIRIALKKKPAEAG